MEKKRYHDLDALRATAMLLGIVLHAILFLKPTSYLELPTSVQSVVELTGTAAPEHVSPYLIMRKAIHGFRMQLFFLISGFFTVMLWKSRGLKQVVSNRFRRIVVPMLVFVPILGVTFPMAAGLGKLATAAIELDRDGLLTTARSSNLLAIRDVRHDADSVQRHAYNALPDGSEAAGFMGDMPPWARTAWQAMAKVSGGESLKHLWFLNYLTWLIAGFLVVAWLVRQLSVRPFPTGVITSPWRWLWLIPITLLPQLAISNFGPDTTKGWIPWLPMLLYYAIFFSVGALCYGDPEFQDGAGRRWLLNLVLAVPAFVLAIFWMETRQQAIDLGYNQHASRVVVSHLFTSLFQVIFVWLMVFGWIGFFHRYFSGESRATRFVSDSSYWLYIAHLPLLIFLKPLVGLLDLPDFVEFVSVCLLTAALLLVLYQTHVRYTVVGSLLNGKRTRPVEAEFSSRSRLTALLLCGGAGILGAHRLYAGCYKSGLLQAGVLSGALVWIAAGGPMFLWVVVLSAAALVVLDFVLIFSGQFSAGDGGRIRHWRPIADAGHCSAPILIDTGSRLDERHAVTADDEAALV